tara:strand:- start:3005 stop:3799 length:795 start_codon:yes stop_codon:yes gene_type:complete
MKETVLTIVQSTLSEMGSDVVNSIDDTTEAQRAALLLKDVYYELINSRTWDEHKQLTALDASGDSNYPNYLKLPELVQETAWVRYDCIKAGETRNRWRTLKYLYPDEFVNLINARNVDSTSIIEVTDWSGTPLLIRNDIGPEYWTSFDDTYIVTDAYDSAVDATLQSSKSQAYVRKEPTFTLADGFVVDLPSEAFSLLKATVKSRAFFSIKQLGNPLLAAEEQRQRNRMSRKNWKAHGGIRTQDYGRSRGRSRMNPTFDQDRNN